MSSNAESETRDQAVESQLLEIRERELDLLEKRIHFLEVSEVQSKRRGRGLSVWLPFLGAILGAIAALLGTYFASVPVREDVMKKYLNGLKGGYDVQFHAVREIAWVYGPEKALEVGRRFSTGATIRALEEVGERASEKEPASLEEFLGSIKRVLFMDSLLSGNIYDEVTRALGGTNVDDIVEEIRELPIRVMGRKVEDSWSRKDEDGIVRLRPHLIVMHLGTFEGVWKKEVEKGAKAKTDVKVVAGFISRISARLQSTRFLVYSRQGMGPLEDLKRKFEDQANVRRRISILEITEYPQRFSNRYHADRLRKAISRNLDLRRLYERSWK